jgi:hypothetical protein
MNNIGGYAGWRWHVKSPIISQHYADNPRVFIIEGLFTILLAITSFFLIVPLPENVTFLTPSEKQQLSVGVGEKPFSIFDRFMRFSQGNALSRNSPNRAIVDSPVTQNQPSSRTSASLPHPHKSTPYPSI